MKLFYISVVVFRLKRRFANKQVLTLKAKLCLCNMQLSKTISNALAKQPSLVHFFFYYLYFFLS